MTKDAARRWLARLILLGPAIAVTFAAVPRLVSGLALEAAFPPTAYMVINIAMPEHTYAQSAQILSHASLGDGETQLLRAEAAERTRPKSPDAVIPLAERALSYAPADARGWIVLAEALRPQDPRKAAAALTLAIELAPREYFLIVPRVLAGAPLWAYLPQETRDTLLGDARFLVQDRNFHAALRSLLAVEGGPQLVTRALAGHPDQIRALNRELAHERMGLN